jgi:hypothetical protein
VGGPCPVHRGLRDVDPCRRGSHPRELGREPAVAAPEIKDAVSGAHAGSKVGEPQLEIGRDELRG